MPGIHAELADQGMPVGCKRVACLMQAAGLQGVSLRRRPRTKLRQPTSRPVPDLVQRNFAVTGSNRLWVADITYVATWAGFLYLAVVVDAWSRRVVGWAMASHLRTELVLAALEMALRQRRPAGVIHHSDQGGQYTALAFGQRCRDAGVRPSMGSVGDCYDNALCESFFATLECELLDRSTFRTRDEVARRCLSSSMAGTIHADDTRPSAMPRPGVTSWPLPIAWGPQPPIVHQNGSTPALCPTAFQMRTCATTFAENINALLH